MSTLAGTESTRSVSLQPPIDDVGMLCLSSYAYARGDDAQPGAPAGQEETIRKHIIEDLAQMPASMGTWEFAWGPGVLGGNLMYAARRKADGQVAMVIRGTTWSQLSNVLEDLEVTCWEHAPWAGSKHAVIAEGAAMGLRHLLNMSAPSFQDGQPSPQRTSALAFLKAEAQGVPGLKVVVTGHSLGGALASVLAPWLASQFASWSAPPPLRCCTFAAPTAGNRAFAEATAPLYGATGSRYFNQYDLVPRAWGALDTLRHLFPDGPATPGWFWAIADVLDLRIRLIGYQHPGMGWMLPTPVQGGDDFEAEVAHQHGCDTYLTAMLQGREERAVRVPLRGGPAPLARRPA